jgi:hypothetical protein
MQQPFTNEYSTSTLEMINACRIHLQVHSMSEITNHQGNMLLECVYQGQCNDNNQPTLWNISTSTLLWPNQQRPPTKAWKSWKEYLTQSLDNKKKLVTILGKWNQYSQSRRKWEYTFIWTDATTIVDPSSQIYSIVTTRTRNTQRYKLTNRQHNGPTTSFLLITPSNTSNSGISINTVYLKTTVLENTTSELFPFASMMTNEMYLPDSQVKCVLSSPTVSGSYFGSIIIDQKNTPYKPTRSYIIRQNNYKHRVLYVGMLTTSTTTDYDH